MTNRRATSPKAIGAAATVVLLWASGFVAVKVALRDMPPGQLAFARYAVAAVAFLFLLLVRRPAIPRRRDLCRLALAGGFGIALYNLALNTGQKTVSAGVASILVNTVPIWTMLLAMGLLGERVGRRGWLGALVSFTGVAIIGLHKGGWAGFDTGVLLILAAAVCQALYFVIAKPLLERYSPVDLTSYAVWFGCALLIPFHSGLEETIRHSSPVTLASVVFLGVGPAAVAYVAWSYVLAELPAGKASNVLFLVPVAALALGWLVLGEIPSPIALFGGGVAILGVSLGRGRRRRAGVSSMGKGRSRQKSKRMVRA